MSAINKATILLLSILFLVVGIGFILFSENGLVEATKDFFQNLLQHTI